MSYPTRRSIVSLAFVALLSGCDILPPEAEPAELVQMITTGRFDILPDTIHIDIGQRFAFRWAHHKPQVYPPPGPTAPDVVFAIYTMRDPEVFQCLLGGPPPRPREFGDPPPEWDDPPRCANLNPPDSLMLLTPELLAAAKQVMPCNQDINPENYSGSGFQECATWSAQKKRRRPRRPQRRSTMPLRDSKS